MLLCFAVALNISRIRGGGCKQLGYLYFPLSLTEQFPCPPQVQGGQGGAVVASFI